MVVGLSSGGLQVHDPDSLQVTYEDRQLAAETISDLAFSPSGDVLAVASHDNNVYLLAANEGWRPVAALKGHSSYVTHVDWSEDGAFLQVRTSWLFLGAALQQRTAIDGAYMYVGVCQSTDGANELLYWDASGRRMPTATDFRDTEWDRWTCAPTTLLSHAVVLSFSRSLSLTESLGLSETGCCHSCPFGWPVAGIWPPNSDGTDINALDRSPQVAATHLFSRCTRAN